VVVRGKVVVELRVQRKKKVTKKEHKEKEKKN